MSDLSDLSLVLLVWTFVNLVWVLCLWQKQKEFQHRQREFQFWFRLMARNSERK